MKTKTRSLPALVNDADTETSKMIRQKYADENGYVTCITCGKVLRWQDAHCAHYVERGRIETRWMETNLHPACSGCNVFNKERHKRRYTTYILDYYGREELDELERLEKIVVSPTRKRQLAEEALAYAKDWLKENT